ncbi:MAG TPA: hypothetical protein VJ698_11585 [Noviherbaspirillum sp.]|uniref:hypothetical protein n=1 Tax=Noviherbaspirillum sp. TaxID=1926288 RepID=UPI002B45A50A|nr:hypothetical protein [Noviherbaspirillum sp.]HJV86104.1 hypothetical protein [Noviherbaspirillum sp.]
MKALPTILIVMLLAGCAGTPMRSSSGASASGMSGASNDLYQYQSQRPGDLYFGD